MLSAPALSSLPLRLGPTSGVVAAGQPTRAEASEARGDRAWARRADGDPQNIRSSLLEATSAYRAALELDPNSVGLRIKLLRSLFVLAEHATPTVRDRKALFEEGRTVFEDGLDRLQRSTGNELRKAPGERLPLLLEGVDEAGPFYFWGALHWGLWGQYFGRIAVIGRGTAKRIRKLGEAAATLDPQYEGAGAYRLLGRLHAQAPRVPLITGWVSRARAVAYLERAHRMAPEEPLNSLFLAEIYIDLRHDRPAAQGVLDDALARDPRPGRELEDGWALTQLRELRNSIGRDQTP